MLGMSKSISSIDKSMGSMSKSMSARSIVGSNCSFSVCLVIGIAPRFFNPYLVATGAVPRHGFSLCEVMVQPKVEHDHFVDVRNMVSMPKQRGTKENLSGQRKDKGYLSYIEHRENKAKSNPCRHRFGTETDERMSINVNVSLGGKL